MFTPPIQALIASLALMEQSVSDLRHTKTTRANAHLMTPLHDAFVQLRKAHWRVLRGWSKIKNKLEVLDFDGAFPVLTDVLTDARSVLHQTRHLAASIDSYHCQTDVRYEANNGSSGVLHYVVFFAIIAIASALFALISRGGPLKPKLN